jgi:ABC-2 type transport system permease protein
MKKILIVARKEVKELFTSKSTLLIGFILAGFFAFSYSQSITDGNRSLNGAIFFLSLAIGLFMAYTSTNQIFLLEKKDGVIETLMCAPVSLRQIWTGKTIAGMVLSWLVSIFAVVVLVIISGIKTGTFIIPDIPVIGHILAGVPLFNYAFVGLVGFGQLLLGMKENRLLNFIVFMPLFAAIFGSGFALAGNFNVTWIHTGIVFGISLLLTGIATWLTGYLSRERIVTTIE